MYEGVKTVNALGGRCEHECIYCSSHTQRKRWKACKVKYNGEYRIYESVMKENWGKNQVIFVCGQNDMFAKGVPDEMILRILEKARDSDESNLYMFQTKNPSRMLEFQDKFPKNHMLGTTIETNKEDLIRKVSKAPPITERAKAMAELSFNHMTYITIEPIMDFDVKELISIILSIVPSKVFIGADSKGHDLPEPSSEKIADLIDALKKFTTVEEKTNLPRLRIKEED